MLLKPNKTTFIGIVRSIENEQDAASKMPGTGDVIIEVEANESKASDDCIQPKQGSMLRVHVPDIQSIHFGERIRATARLSAGPFGTARIIVERFEHL